MPDDNHMLYVEPVVVSGSDEGSTLLAGTHNHLFQNTPGEGWKLVSGDSVFGAIVSSSGRARIVRSPISMRLVSGIRAVARDGGGWSVVFAEVKPWSGEMRPDTAARLWYGVLNEGRWAELDTLPLPDVGVLHPFVASSLAQDGRNLAWAIPRTGNKIRAGILIYERRGGRWSYEVIPTGSAQADLAYSAKLGLVAAVEQADFRLQRDANSLLFWTRDPTWTILRSVVPGSRELVHNPSLTLAASRSALTWEAEIPGRVGGRRSEAHAISGRPEDPGAPAMVLDPDIVPTYPISFVPLLRGPRLWVTDHRLPDEKREIRIVRDSAGIPALVSQMPNPYFTPFRAGLSGPSEVLISGGVLDRERGVGHSLLLRIRIRCPAGSQ